MCEGLKRFVHFPPTVVLVSALLLVAGLAANSTSAQVRSDSESAVEGLFRQAQSAQDRGDYAEAAASYRKVVAIRPDLAEAWTNLGIMYHLLDLYNEAIKPFQAALQRDPKLFVPNVMLGIDLLRLGKPEEALNYLNRAHYLNPKDEQTSLKLGEAYAAIRDYSSANFWYGRTVLLNPNNSDAEFGLGITYIDLQDSAVAQLARIGHDSAYGQILLAESFLQQGRTNDSIQIYQKIINSHIKIIGLHAGLGFAFLQDHQFSEAKGEFQAELAQSPFFLQARLGTAMLLLQEGKTRQSSLELEDIWKCDKRFVEANLGTPGMGMSIDQERGVLGSLNELNADPCLLSFLQSGEAEGSPSRPATESDSCKNDSQPPGPHSAGSVPSEKQSRPELLFAQGRYTDCTERLLLEFAKLDPSDMVLLARCSNYAGDFRTSLKAAMRAAQTGGSNPEALYWQVKSLERLSIAALMGAGLADPTSVHVHMLLADLYLKKKNYKLAESEYQQVVNLKPMDLAGHLGLATVYWQSDAFERALPEIQKVLDAHPLDPEASYLMGTILVGRHEYAEARPYVVLAFSAQGKTAFYAHALLGKICTAQGQYNEAIQELNKALSVDKDGSIHIQLYQLYKKVGDQKAADIALQGAQALQKQEEEASQAAIQPLQ